GYGYPAQAPPGYGAPPPGFPAPGYPGYAKPTGPAPGVEFASFLQRAGAVIVDGLIFMIPVIVCLVILGVSAGQDGGGGNSAGIAVGVLGLVLLGIAACAYQIVLPAQGGTWGMRMVRIRVARADNGANIGIPLALGRWAVMAAISFFGFYWLDALWMLWDPLKQTLHDKAVSTYVVRTG
ncbi:MAG TPA: RDD family protein, partial [Candidatus Dormibacteraeota bacterium]